MTSTSTYHSNLLTINRSCGANQEEETKPY